MNKFYYKKKVIITGHTGFKGSWLCLWLTLLGAKVYGVSLYHPSTPSHFKSLKIEKKIESYKIDIKNKSKIKTVFQSIKPDFVFHLAAQPIVKQSYLDPHNTFFVNAIGTLNILEAVNSLKNKCTLISITSDKCYENVELKRGYKENDILGGADPYSASKASAEIILSSYFRSFLSKKSNILLGIGRAGNVIGGGDWAKNRIIPDCVRSWHRRKPVILRNPRSTRPWQHVLEPLSGYLLLGYKLDMNRKINGEAYNFGPPNHQNKTVSEVVSNLSSRWQGSEWSVADDKNKVYEAGLLKLNCTKSKKDLNWKSSLNFDETLKMTYDWYDAYYNKKLDMLKFGQNQIEEYTSIATSKGIKWIKQI